MGDDASRHQRRSIRLTGYDYAQAGAYFVTICTLNRLLLFERDTIRAIATECWLQIPAHFPTLELDEWIIMPNHIHGILVITTAAQGRGVQLNAPTRSGNMHSQLSPYRGTLGVVIRTYKGAVTTLCRQTDQADFAWQRNYYERIIRNEDELNRARQYIIDNPQNWSSDLYNPGHVEAFN